MSAAELVGFFDVAEPDIEEKGSRRRGRKRKGDASEETGREGKPKKHRTASKVSPASTNPVIKSMVRGGAATTASAKIHSITLKIFFNDDFAFLDKFLAFERAQTAKAWPRTPHWHGERMRRVRAFMDHLRANQDGYGSFVKIEHGNAVEGSKAPGSLETMHVLVRSGRTSSHYHVLGHTKTIAMFKKLSRSVGSVHMWPPAKVFLNKASLESKTIQGLTRGVVALTTGEVVHPETKQVLLRFGAPKAELVGKLLQKNNIPVVDNLDYYERYLSLAYHSYYDTAVNALSFLCWLSEQPPAVAGLFVVPNPCLLLLPRPASLVQKTPVALWRWFLKTPYAVEHTGSVWRGFGGVVGYLKKVMSSLVRNDVSYEIRRKDAAEQDPWELLTMDNVEAFLEGGYTARVAKQGVHSGHMTAAQRAKLNALMHRLQKHGPQGSGDRSPTSDDEVPDPSDQSEADSEFETELELDDEAEEGQEDEEGDEDMEVVDDAEAGSAASPDAASAASPGPGEARTPAEQSSKVAQLPLASSERAATIKNEGTARDDGPKEAAGKIEKSNTGKSRDSGRSSESESENESEIESEIESENSRSGSGSDSGSRSGSESDSGSDVSEFSDVSSETSETSSASAESDASSISSGSSGSSTATNNTASSVNSQSDQVRVAAPASPPKSTEEGTTPASTEDASVLTTTAKGRPTKEAGNILQTSQASNSASPTGPPPKPDPLPVTAPKHHQQQQEKEPPAPNNIMSGRLALPQGDRDLFRPREPSGQSRVVPEDEDLATSDDAKSESSESGASDASDASDDSVVSETSTVGSFDSWASTEPSAPEEQAPGPPQWKEVGADAVEAMVGTSTTRRTRNVELERFPNMVEFMEVLVLGFKPSEDERVIQSKWQEMFSQLRESFTPAQKSDLAICEKVQACTDSPQNCVGKMREFFDADEKHRSFLAKVFASEPLKLYKKYFFPDDEPRRFTDTEFYKLFIEAVEKQKKYGGCPKRPPL